MEKTNLILIGVLVLMVVVAGVQVVQFNSMKNKLSGVDVSGVTSTSSSLSAVSSPSSSSGSSSTGVLANLPSQVGGC